MKKAESAVIQELKRLAEERDGVLTPEAVVDAARVKSCPLHKCFEWDDTEAAAAWRLHQARNLLRVCVQILPNDKAGTECKVFVSLTPDREETGGGYRLLTRVLSQADQRAQLLADALAELRVFQAKYEALTELADVFAAVRRVRVKRG